MTVSIIMPVRNAEKTLHESIRSVLYQDFDDYEIICVVNDSTDKSEEIITKYSEATSRGKIRILHSEKGIVPALNMGLQNAKFDLIARQDADDIWHEEKLKKQVSFMRHNEHIDILGTQIKIIDQNYNEINQEPKRPTKDLDIKRSLLSGWNVIAHSSVIFRKRILERTGGYDDTFPFAEDYSLWLRAMQWYKFEILDETLLSYMFKHNPNYDHNVPRFLASIYQQLYGIK